MITPMCYLPVTLKVRKSSGPKESSPIYTITTTNIFHPPTICQLNDCTSYKQETVRVRFVMYIYKIVLR